MNDFLSGLLQAAVSVNAEDIHLQTGLPVRVRVNGKIQTASADNVSAEQISEALRCLTTQAKMKTLLDDGSIDFHSDWNESYFIRGNAWKSDQGTSAVLRLISTTVRSLDEIHAPAVFKEWLSIPYGLILVNGPAGSGKTTTQYAMLKEVVAAGKVVITVEDPIHIPFPTGRGQIFQREVRTHTPNYARGLRDSLRIDPDVILIGSLANKEVLSTALQAAETGHLVIASLPGGRDIVSSIERLLDMYAFGENEYARAQLAATLIGVSCQELLPTADGSGRLAVFEYLTVDQTVRNAIRYKDQLQVLNQFLETKTDSRSFARSIAELADTGAVVKEIADPRRLRSRTPEQEGADREAAVATARALVLEQPATVARLLTDWLGADESGPRKAAVFAVAVGPSLAEALRQLNPRSIDQLMIEMAAAVPIPADEAEQVLVEGTDIVRRNATSIPGGIGVAADLLEAALGEDKAMEIIEKLSAVVQVIPFDFLRRVNPLIAAKVLQQESLETLAVVMSYAPPEAAAKILAELPKDTQLALVDALTQTRHDDPAVIRDLEGELQAKLSEMLNVREVVVGPEKLALLLAHADQRTRKNLLAALVNSHGEEFVAELRKQTFMFEDIFTLPERELQLVLRDADLPTLALSLKGATSESLDAVRGHLSERQWMNLEDEIAGLGRRRLSEVEAAQQATLALVRRLDAEGVISISSDIVE